MGWKYCHANFGKYISEKVCMVLTNFQRSHHFNDAISKQVCLSLTKFSKRSVFGQHNCEKGQYLVASIAEVIGHRFPTFLAPISKLFIKHLWQYCHESNHGEEISKQVGRCSTNFQTNLNGSTATQSSTTKVSEKNHFLVAEICCKNIGIEPSFTAVRQRQWPKHSCFNFSTLSYARADTCKMPKSCIKTVPRNAKNTRESPREAYSLTGVGRQPHFPYGPKVYKSPPIKPA